MPNKLAQFWQELKRRNVIRVITVYAGAAFVILELVDILGPALGLPQWTLNFILVLLIVGFVITVTVSWIYDIHPEGGIVKTEPVHKVKTEDKPKSSNGWKVASYISFVVIVGLIVLNVLPRDKGIKAEELPEKSIAVLPFINDSPDIENEYFMNGIMDELLIKLQTIEDLRVVSRSSVEQFRGQTRPSIPEIAEKLDVNYVVEGSGQKYGNTFILRIQLIQAANDDHLWANSYEEQLESVEVVTRIHAEISESIATELKAIITPEEKGIIEKSPTTDLTAYDFYHRGNEEFQKYRLDNSDKTALHKAENLFREALRIDPTFAQAYSGLGFTYWEKHFSDEFFSVCFMDSALILADIALSYDKELSDAYRLRGSYYREAGEMARAEEEFDKGIRYNPNDWLLYRNKAGLFAHDEHVNYLENMIIAASLNRGPERISILQGIRFSYLASGFLEKAIEINQEVLKLSGDTADYYRTFANIKNYQGNVVESHELLLKANRLDSMYFIWNPALGASYLRIGEKEAGLECYKKYEMYYESTGDISSLIWNYQRIGYAYWANGFREEAESYFHKLIESSTQEIELGRFRSELYYTYYDLASVYAILGQKEKAYENLRIFNQKKIMHLWMFDLIKYDPLFDSIRDEPEFQQIVRDVEAKYQAEHERVRQWLEENEML